jgi:anti-anti-sigma factor
MVVTASARRESLDVSSKNPDPYGIQDDPTAKVAPEKKAADADADADAGDGGRFSSRIQGAAQVIRFSRTDVVDGQYIQQLGDDLYRHFKPVPSPRVVIDMENVRFLSSSALGMLIALKKVIERQDGKICLCRVHDDLYGVFKITKLHKLLGIHDTVEKAVAKVS